MQTKSASWIGFSCGFEETEGPRLSIFHCDLCVLVVLEDNPKTQRSPRSTENVERESVAMDRPILIFSGVRSSPIG